MSTNENIHAGHRERTINKFLRFPDSFNDHEILEVLLFYAIPRRDTNPLAHKLIKVFGSLEKVLSATADELMSVDGVGKSTAAAIMLIGKINAITIERALKSERILAPANAKSVVKDYLKHKPNETFIMVLLNAKKEVMTVLEYTDDKKEEVTADIPELSHAMSIHKAKYAIIAHNHPSRIARPSTNDDMATKKVSAICNIHGVKLTDHLILGGEEVFSYHSNGLMEDIHKQTNIEKLLSKVQGEE
jgi:DNA repair protein RadC